MWASRCFVANPHAARPAATHFMDRAKLYSEKMAQTVCVKKICSLPHKEISQSSPLSKAVDLLVFRLPLFLRWTTVGGRKGLTSGGMCGKRHLPYLAMASQQIVLAFESAYGLTLYIDTKGETIIFQSKMDCGSQERNCYGKMKKSISFIWSAQNFGSDSHRNLFSDCFWNFWKLGFEKRELRG